VIDARTISEIFHSAERCAADVFAVMQSMVDAEDRETMSWREAWASGAEHAKKETAAATHSALRDERDVGFERGIKHAVEAMAVELVGLHPEEHF